MKLGWESAVAKGRPRGFDPDDALAAALRIFCRDGYAAASLTHLTAEMGITKSSLYSTFGNKEALFYKALDLYDRDNLAYTNFALSAPTARTVAERLLRGALDSQARTGNPTGCLGIVAASASSSDAISVRALVIARRASSEDAVVRRFETARDEGELPETLEPRALASYLFALLQGLVVQGGSGVPAADLEQLVQTGMSVWPTR